MREAELVERDGGLVPASEGWFVVNARDVPWATLPGQGRAARLTGRTEEEVEALFPMLGMAIRVLGPGEPLSMYHREPEQEGFLVLSGTPLLLVEGEERALKPWDFVHCPPLCAHTIVGAGSTPSVVLAVGTRAHQATADPHTTYLPDPTAQRHGAAIADGTPQDEAYARFAPETRGPYPGALLPGA